MSVTVFIDAALNKHSRMTRKVAETEENFEALLCWLDENRETAGQKYEKIRSSLIRIFNGRGCFESEDLADETISRVTLKLPQIIDSYEGEPVRYFYGVAQKIHLEWLRRQKRAQNARFVEEESDADDQIEYECLEDCLKTLADEDRALIVEYYRSQKKEKIESRRKLAEELGISLNAMHVKAHRIRGRLQNCVRNCAAEKKRL